MVAAVGAFYLLTIRQGHVWGDDFAQYILHARNLIRGLPYGQTGYLYNPHNPIAPPMYPPVFPLLLAPVIGLFGLNLTAMKVEVILCFLAALGCMFVVSRERLSTAGALVVIAAVGFNPLVWNFKDEILSDFSFLLFCYAALACLMRGRAFVGGVCLALACGTRSLGIVLVAAVVLADLLHTRRLSRATLIALMPVALLAAVQRLWLGHGPGYLDQLGNTLRMAWVNFWYYGKELRDVWRNGYAGFWMRLFFLAANGLGFWGYVRSLRRRVTALEIFPLLYVIVLIIWPAYQGFRFLLPLVPLYFLYLLEGMRQVAWLAPIRRQRRAVIALSIILAVTYIARYTTLPFGPIDQGMEHPDTVEVFDYVKQHTPPEAVLVVGKPRAFALYTGRTSTVYHWTQPDPEHWEYLRRIGATYAIVSPIFFTDQFFRLFIARNPSRFHELFSNPNFMLYQIE